MTFVDIVDECLTDNTAVSIRELWMPRAGRWYMWYMVHSCGPSTRQSIKIYKITLELYSSMVFWILAVSESSLHEINFAVWDTVSSLIHTYHIPRTTYQRTLLHSYLRFNVSCSHVPMSTVHCLHISSHAYCLCKKKLFFASTTCLMHMLCADIFAIWIFNCKRLLVCLWFWCLRVH